MKKLLLALLGTVVLGVFGGCAGTGGYGGDYPYPYYGPGYGAYPGDPFYNVHFFGHFHDGHNHHPAVIHRPHDGRHGHHGKIDQRRHTVRERHPGHFSRDQDRRYTREDRGTRQELGVRDGFSGRSPRDGRTERFSREPGLRCAGPRC